MLNDFIAEPVQLGLELSADVAGGEQGGIAGDAIGFASTEVFQSIGWWMDVKDVRTINLTVETPHAVNASWIASSVVVVDVVSISRRKCNDSGIVEHP